MRSLVHIDGNNISWSAAVARVADALNPLGSAAQIVTSLGACAVEIRQIQLEEMKARRTHDHIDAVLRQRQADIVRVFDLQYSLARNAQVTYNELQFGHRTMLRLATDFGISEDERQIAQQTATFYVQSMVTAHQGHGNQLVQLAQSLNLVPLVAVVNPWRELTN